MNLFGPALEKALDAHKVGKSEFAKSCGLHRNQLTNIITGKASNPNSIGTIFAALAGLVSFETCVDLAILFLEDRRTELGVSSGCIQITRANGTTANSERDRLLAIYDRDDDVRKAIDAVIDVLSPKTESPCQWGTRSALNAADLPGDPYKTK